MVPVLIRGPGGLRGVVGLADTGADDTLLPERLLAPLGVVPDAKDYLIASGFSGDPLVVRHARVDLEIATSGEVHRWSARVGFHPGHKVILGHQGFFDAYTASFNGRRRLRTLTPNGTAPGPIFGAI